MSSLVRFENLEILISPACKMIQRKLFWLGSGGLYSSELTGEGLNVTAFAKGLTPYRLCVDTHFQTIYVMAGAAEGLKLLSCSYDGTGVKEIIKIPHTESKVYGFGIIGNVAYWESNFDGEKIYKANITSEGSSPIISTVYEINKIVNDVKIFHRDLQKPKENIDVETVLSQKKVNPNERIQRIG